MTDKDKMREMLLEQVCCSLIENEAVAGFEFAWQASNKELKAAQDKYDRVVVAHAETISELEADRECYTLTNRALNHVTKELELAIQQRDFFKDAKRQAESDASDARNSLVVVRRELEVERNLCAEYIEKSIDYDKELEEAKQRLVTLERNAQDEIDRLENQKLRLSEEKEALEKKLGAVTIERDLYASDAKRCWELMPELANSDADYELHEAVQELTKLLAAAFARGHGEGYAMGFFSGKQAESDIDQATRYR